MIFPLIEAGKNTVLPLSALAELISPEEDLQNLEKKIYEALCREAVYAPCRLYRCTELYDF